MKDIDLALDEPLEITRVILITDKGTCEITLEDEGDYNLSVSENGMVEIKRKES